MKACTMTFLLGSVDFNCCMTVPCIFYMQLKIIRKVVIHLLMISLTVSC